MLKILTKKKQNANVTGIVTELGGRTSHSAILARALEIPAVVAVNSFIEGAEILI